MSEAYLTLWGLFTDIAGLFGLVPDGAGAAARGGQGPRRGWRPRGDLSPGRVGVAIRAVERCIFDELDGGKDVPPPLSPAACTLSHIDVFWRNCCAWRVWRGF